jgi:Tfp pilus assembly protein FimT
MLHFRTRLRSLARSGRGQTLSEYAVSLTVITILLVLGLQTMSSTIASELQTAVGIL